MNESRTTQVLIAGAGVAGMETALALRAHAGDRVRITLLDPSPSFTERPRLLAAAFAGDPPPRIPLSELAAAADAELLCDRLARVSPDERAVSTGRGRKIVYDALVVAIGAEPLPAYRTVPTLDVDAPHVTLQRLRAHREGVRVAVLVPPGRHWVLAGYEFALALARERPADSLTLVVPEPLVVPPLGIGGAKELEGALTAAGVELITGHSAEPLSTSRILLHPGGRVLDVDDTVALPRLVPPPVPGVGVARGDFVPTDATGAVVGMPAVYAAGDITTRGLKHGAAAALEGDAVAASIARLAGCDAESVNAAEELRNALAAMGVPRLEVRARHLGPLVAGRTRRT